MVTSSCSRPRVTHMAIVMFLQLFPLRAEKDGVVCRHRCPHLTTTLVSCSNCTAPCQEECKVAENSSKSIPDIKFQDLFLHIKNSEILSKAHKSYAHLASATKEHVQHIRSTLKPLLEQRYRGVQVSELLGLVTGVVFGSALLYSYHAQLEASEAALSISQGDFDKLPRNAYKERIWQAMSENKKLEFWENCEQSGQLSKQDQNNKLYIELKQSQSANGDRQS